MAQPQVLLLHKFQSSLENHLCSDVSGTGDEVVLGLSKRDKERTRKRVEKYQARPNMEATKCKCVLGCPQKFHNWGSLCFCEMLLHQDTIAGRKRLCFDHNICLLCLCPGHRQIMCRISISCAWCPPNRNRHNTIFCTHTSEAEILEWLCRRDGKMTYLIDCQVSIFSLNCTSKDKDLEQAAASMNHLQVEEEEESDKDISDEEVEGP